MRFASYLASTVFAVTALASTAALAGPINVGPGGSIITDEFSWEVPTVAPSQVLQGVVEVNAINAPASLVNPVYTTGSGGQFLSAVFGGFTLVSLSQTAPDASGNSTFHLAYTGGFINYYTSPTNPFSNLAILNTATALADATTAVTSGTPWLGFTAETIALGGITLTIDGTTQGLGFGSVTDSHTSTVFLDLVNGFGLSGIIQQNTYFNPWLNQLADATYTGHASSIQCASHGITPTSQGGLSPFQICGSNDLATQIIPEPFTLSLFGAGLAGVAAIRRRKAKKAA